MTRTLALILSCFLPFLSTAIPECENGWIAYKQELCIKAFTDKLLTYDDAKSFCSLQAIPATKATLVMVKNSDMQQTLENYIQNHFDKLWLGSKYDQDSGTFKWEDEELLAYNNWAEGYPRNISDVETCISLRPTNANSKITGEGNWVDVVCQQRNVPLCQRTLSWTLQDAVEEIIKLRKRDTDLQNEIDAINSRVVPVGSIYIEYFNQPSPSTLWPSLIWQDVTSNYAGLFFRAQGDGSGNWGTTQTECAPRFTEMNGRDAYERFIDVIFPESGWSDYVYIGDRYDGQAMDYLGLRFHTTSCEIRPKNQAVRLWKRTA